MFPALGIRQALQSLGRPRRQGPDSARPAALLVVLLRGQTTSLAISEASQLPATLGAPKSE